MWHAEGRKARAVGLAFLVTVLAFWPTLISFGDVWSRYTYSHGYLVPPLALWLVWRRRDVLLEPAPGTRFAIPALVLLAVLWFAATVANVQVVHEGVFPLILLAWTGLVGGWRAVRAFAPAAAVFLFAVPFWEVLSRPLQAVTIAVNGVLVRAMGIEAEITGPYVILPWGAFEIADSCSGLNLFIVGLLLGLLYAHLFTRRWRARITVVALSVALAIVANWIRVTGLVVIGHMTEMQWEHLEDHGFYGWVVFVVVFIGFFPLAERIRARYEGGAPRPDPRTVGVPSWDAPTTMAPRPRLLLATALAVLGPATWMILRAAPAAEMDSWSLPSVGDEWTRIDDPAALPGGWEPAYAEPDARVRGAWTDGSTEIHLLALQYERQEQGRELVGGGNRIASASDLVGEQVSWIRERNAWVREALVRTPEGPVAVWYWYEIGGVTAVSPIKAKLLELVAFVRRRPSSVLVTLSVSCVSEQCRDEREALRAFLPTD